MQAKADRLGFIGAGNMAGALIRGLVKSGLYSPEQLAASDPDRDKLALLSEETGIRRVESNLGLVRESTAVVLAVKPQVLKGVLEEIKEEAKEGRLFISIAAGIPMSTLTRILGQEVPLIRVMPNTPALVGMGMSALAPGAKASEEQVEIARCIFEAVGEAVVIDESMMNEATAVSGSGPGYVFRIMEAMAAAAEALGFSKEESVKLVVQTFLGAARLAADSGKGLDELREMVTSPGGTTQAGLSVLESAGIQEIMRRTVEAAEKRASELGS
jgi:pyrroline-5-carboxylate reductase